MSKNICRVCLNHQPLELCENIYNYLEEHTIAQQIMKCASVEILRTDGNPEIICQICLNDLQIALNFKNRCEQSDKVLNQSKLSLNVKSEQKNPKIMNVKSEKIENFIDNQQTPEYDEIIKVEFLEDDLDLHLPEQESYLTDPDSNFTDRDINLLDPDINLTTTNPDENYAGERSGSLYSCILCNADFDRRKSYSDHITNDHVKLKGIDETCIECNHCGKEFKKYDYVRAHIFEMHLNQKRREKKKELSMLLLGENDENHREIVKTKKTKEKTIKPTVKKKRPYPCLLCEVIFSNTMKLSAHIQTHLITNSKEKPHFQCKHCPSTAATYSSLRTHCYLKHQLSRKKRSNLIDLFLTPIETKKQPIQNQYSSQRVWKCVCQKTFTKTEEFTVHIKNDHCDFDPENNTYLVNCFKCDKIFSNYKLMRTHFFEAHLHLRNVQRKIKNHNKAMRKQNEQINRYKAPVYCIICDDQFVGRAVLIEHVNKDHMQLDGDEMKLNCPQCDVKLPTYNPLLAHLRIVHKKYPKGSRRFAMISSGAAMKQLLCPHCARSFSDNANLNRHIMVKHEKRKPVSCTHCDMTFITKTGMTKHFLVMHTDEKSFSCDKCDKKFAIWDQLRRHKQKHGPVTEYKCSVCDKKYSTQRDHDRHAKLHGPKSFACEFCSRTFVIKKYLEKHLRSHGKSAVLCKYCNRQFLKSSQLKAHLMDHDDIIQ